MTLTYATNQEELAYLSLLSEIVENGSYRMDRTGVGTYALFGRTLRFNLANGFPLITTKKVPFKVVLAELIGFIHALDSAAQFRALGCSIWDQNANENQQWVQNPHRKGPDDLGAIYGVQWRKLPHPSGTPKDQLAELIHKLKHNPSDRRLVVWAYNPAFLEHMALPPCHMGFQCFVDNGLLSLIMTQRSADAFLGVPFNIASYALLLRMLAQVCDLIPHELIINFGDIHVYANHLEVVKEQLSRTPFPFPKLWLDDQVKSIDDFSMASARITDYECGGALKAPMAV